MIFKRVESPEPVIKYLSEAISKQLKVGRDVLWLLSGGSSVPFQVEVARALQSEYLSNLTAVLTDERYGPVGHAESNWQKLLDAGFELPGATLYPILSGKDMDTTANDFSAFISKQLESTSYKIVCLGVGADGHCLGVLCNSTAVHTDKTVIAYQGSDFPRITMSLKTMRLVDESLTYMVGEAKHPVIDQLANQKIDLSVQPAQILKQIKKAIIFNDQYDSLHSS